MAGPRDDNPRRSVVVDESAAGERVDRFLVRAGLAKSGHQARALVAARAVRVDRRSTKKGDTLRAGSVVEVDLPAPDASGAEGITPDATLALRVLFEDEHLVAVDKPGGVPSHPLRPGERGTVASALVARYPECARASLDPREGGLAHRLDTGTSGVLVAARTREAWQALRAALGRQDCEKTYWAEVALPTAGAPAEPPTEPTRVIEAAIGRRGRRGGRVTLDRGRGVLPARTEARLRARARDGATGLVEARLSHGRAHQVRAHLAHAGWPILGDDRYGDAWARAIAEALGVRELRLHARRLTFRHPIDDVVMTLEAPLPDWARSWAVPIE